MAALRGLKVFVLVVGRMANRMAWWKIDKNEHQTYH